MHLSNHQQTKLLHCAHNYIFLLFVVLDNWKSHGNWVFFHLDWGLMHLHLQIVNVWGRKHLSFNGNFCFYFCFLLSKFNKTNLKFNSSKIFAVADYSLGSFYDGKAECCREFRELLFFLTYMEGKFSGEHSSRVDFF